MKLSTQQVKEAKNFCKANGIDPKKVNAQLGWGFWEENCNSTFEGYLNHLSTTAKHIDGSVFQKLSDASLKNYREGNYGKKINL